MEAMATILAPRIMGVRMPRVNKECLVGMVGGVSKLGHRKGMEDTDT